MALTSWVRRSSSASTSSMIRGISSICLARGSHRGQGRASRIQTTSNFVLTSRACQCILRRNAGVGQNLLLDVRTNVFCVFFHSRIVFPSVFFGAHVIRSVRCASQSRCNIKGHYNGHKCYWWQQPALLELLQGLSRCSKDTLSDRKTKRRGKAADRKAARPA